MAPTESVLTRGEGVMGFPEADNLADHDPNPQFPKNLQEHEWAEAVQGDPIFWVFGFRAEPPPLEPGRGGAAKRL